MEFTVRQKYGSPQRVIVFGTGEELAANGYSVCLSLEGDVEESGLSDCYGSYVEPEKLSLAARKELAEAMSARWLEWGARQR